MLEIRGFSAETRSVINDLAVDFSGGVVDERHMALTLLSVIGKDYRYPRL